MNCLPVMFSKLISTPADEADSVIFIIHSSLKNRMKSDGRVQDFLSLVYETGGLTPFCSSVMRGIPIQLAVASNPLDAANMFADQTGVREAVDAMPALPDSVPLAVSYVFFERKSESPMALVVISERAFDSDAMLFYAMCHELIGIVPSMLSVSRPSFEAGETPPFLGDTCVGILHEITAHAEVLKYFRLLIQDEQFREDFLSLAFALPGLIQCAEVSILEWARQLNASE